MSSVVSVSSSVFLSRNVFGLRLNKVTRVVTWATRFPSDALALGQHYMQTVCMQVVRGGVSHLSLSLSLSALHATSLYASGPRRRGHDKKMEVHRKALEEAGVRGLQFEKKTLVFETTGAMGVETKKMVEISDWAVQRPARAWRAHQSPRARP